MKKSLFQNSALVGLFAVLLFIACTLWRFTISDPLVAEHHLLSLRVAFPGFTDFGASSMIMGIVYSFVYGFVIAIVFRQFHLGCCDKRK